jgi:hypothetical protein
MAGAHRWPLAARRGVGSCVAYWHSATWMVSVADHTAMSPHVRVSAWEKQRIVHELASGP